jgi:hypothetical protein
VPVDGHAILPHLKWVERRVIPHPHDHESPWGRRIFGRTMSASAPLEALVVPLG